jgi:hypothetical protein
VYNVEQLFWLRLEQHRETSMIPLDLAPRQLDVAHAPPARRIYAEGVAGTGKTTAAVARLTHLLDAGVPADAILVVTPQRTLAEPYYEALRAPDLLDGGMVTVATIGGLARRMIDLFWPLVAEEAGFSEPEARPIFLTLETAQYYMARVVGPLITREGYFEAITIDRSRLYSQILDNLNKSAVVGFSPTEIAERLKGAWMGELSQASIYDQAQNCALAFRRYCLEHNLLDFSLQITLFAENLWQEPLCRDHLTGSYRHLIVDNVEEDTPVAHDVLYAWLATTESALIVLDRDAGYRSFLGADPRSGAMLRDLCDTVVTFSKSFVVSTAIAGLSGVLSRALTPVAPRDATEREAQDGVGGDAGDPIADEQSPLAQGDGSAAAIRGALHFGHHRFHPEMLDWVADSIRDLVYGEGVAPKEIVVLAPFLTDALRFSLTHRLTHKEVPTRSHRPSRALREEPATHTLLTLAALAHPEWHILPSKYDVAYALRHAIGELDLVRAQLLAEIVYRPREGMPALGSFDEIKPEMQQRITYSFGERYEGLRGWLERYREQALSADAVPALDHMLARLFGEVLSQAGYGFYRDSDAGRMAAMLIESVRKFRWTAIEVEGKTLGQEYLEMVRDGVIAAQYLQLWRPEPENAVLLAPAYTFLLANRPVDVQFWLNIGGQGWWERLYQPLTHPYVLSRRWVQGKVWTDEEEYRLRQTSLQRVALGLLRRCREALYLGLCELSEQGYEQEGALLRVFQRVLRQL